MHSIVIQNIWGYLECMIHNIPHREMEVIVRIESFMNNTDRPLITNVRLTLIATPSYLEDQEDQLEQGDHPEGVILLQIDQGHPPEGQILLRVGQHPHEGHTLLRVGRYPHEGRILLRVGRWHPPEGHILLRVGLKYLPEGHILLQVGLEHLHEGQTLP